MPTSLTVDDLKDMIEKEAYLIPEGTTMTICVLTLKNDHMVIGHSRPISAENFDIDKGRKAAFDRAFAQLWDLGGFAARQEAYERPSHDAEIREAFDRAET
jgi:hypothetical protein